MSRECRALSELVEAWDLFFKAHDWKDLIHGYQPITTLCGVVYELPNYLSRENQSCAIIDMRTLAFTEPHYHKVGIEVYFIITGSGTIVLGSQERYVTAGEVIVINPYTSHFVIPEKNLVMGVINTPSFSVDDYYPLNKTSLEVGFDNNQFVCHLSALKITDSLEL